MKQRILATLLASATMFVNAQIYVNSSGYVSVGSTGSSNSVPFQSFGNALFATSPTGSNSAAWIHAANGYSGANAPDYSWWYDSQTGIFHPAGYQIGFSVGNYQVMNLNVAGNGEAYFYNSNTSTSSYPWATANYVNSTSTISWMLDYYNGTSHAQNFYVYGSGNAWSYGWHSLSDARLKQNIDTIHNALSKVVKLCGLTYKWNPATTYKGISGKTQMGLLAQEVAKVVPEVVDTGKDSVLGIEYQNLVPLLIQAIKEQNGRIDSLASALTECCNRTHERNKQNPSDTGSSSIKNTTTTQIELANNNDAILYQNVPNPFSGSTEIRYFIPENTQGDIYISFADMYGSEVKHVQITNKGFGKIEAGTAKLASGIYTYSLIVNGKVVDTKKMVKNQ